MYTWYALLDLQTITKGLIRARLDLKEGQGNHENSELIPFQRKI